MKRFLLALVLMVPLVVGCARQDNTEQTIKYESFTAIQKQLLNGESLIIDSITVIKDSIPYIFDAKLIRLYRDFDDACSEFEKVRDSYGYSKEEKFMYLKKVGAAATAFSECRDSLKSGSQDFGYIALVSTTAKNTQGADLTPKAVVLFTDTLSLKPSGCFLVSGDFSQTIYEMLNADENVRLTSSKYGLIEVDSLPKAIGFILEGLRAQ